MTVPLTIVIPSFNGAQRLPRLLKNLKSQVSDQDEILVVNDASTDETQSIAHDGGARVVNLDANSGVGAARNKGGKESTCEILVFLDDDIIPAENYLNCVRSLFEDPNILCCQGLHRLEPANLNPNIWHYVEALLWRHEMGSHQIQNNKCYSLFSQSFCIRQSHFLKTKGFIEDFPGAGAEEFEYASRLLDAGEITFAPELETAHAFQSLVPRLKTLFRRARRFPEVYHLASNRWRLRQWSEYSCLILAAIFLASVIGTLLWTECVYGILLSIVGFLFIDFSLVTNSWRWGRFSLFPIAFSVRIIQYTVIGLGAFLGLMNSYVKRT